MTTWTLTDTDIGAISTKVCEKPMDSRPPALLPMMKEILPSILHENIPSLASKITKQQKL